MTARELYEYALIELNKLEAPSLLLEDYNYFINKAVQQYINLVYAKLEIDQQSTDDIRVLKTSAILKPVKLSANPTYSHLDLTNGMFKSSYYVDLPADYMHLLNCIVEYKVGVSNFKCYNKGDMVYFAARKLTPDMYTQVLNNAYMRPMYKRPYYYLSNINTDTTLPTNPNMDEEVLSANGSESATNEQKATYYAALSNYHSALAAYNANKTEETKATLDTATEALNSAKEAIRGTTPPAEPTSSLVDAYNKQGDRLANPSIVRLELRYGTDDGVFVPNNIYVDYLKSPMYIRLTQEQINSTLDYSQVLEFPDYVCFEIANIFVRLLMENASDPRLQTNMPINSTIAAPAAIQAAQQQAQQ